MTSKLDEHFPGELQRWEYIRREADSELIVLKDDKDEDGRSPPIDYRETKDTRRWRGQVARINKRLASANIELIPDRKHDDYLAAGLADERLGGAQCHGLGAVRADYVTGTLIWLLGFRLPVSILAQLSTASPSMQSVVTRR
jgi:hypothetical protein